MKFLSGSAAEADDCDMESVCSCVSCSCLEASSTSFETSVSSQPESVTGQFAILFTNNPVLRPIILNKLEMWGVAGFEHTFIELLRLYSQDLCDLSLEGPQGEIAAVMACQRTRGIAHRTASMSGFLQSHQLAMRGTDSVEEPRNDAVIEGFLEDEERSSSPHGGIFSGAEDGSDPILPEQHLGEGYMSSELGDEHEIERQDVREAYQNLNLVKHLLVSTSPLQTLARRHFTQSDSWEKATPSPLPGKDKSPSQPFGLAQSTSQSMWVWLENEFLHLYFAAVLIFWVFECLESA